MTAPPFVVFEGPEGAGKSSQIALVAAALARRGTPHRVTREPGGTPLAEAIRTILLDREDLELDGVAELLLFSAARRAHVEEVIRPALRRGEVVLCDRFELSTRVYQGLGRGVPLATIEAVTAAATGGLRPDLYLVLDVPTSVGRARQRGAELFPDRIEREHARFMERVREGYADLAERDPDIVPIDASGSSGQVARAIREVLHERLPSWFEAPGTGV